MRIKQYYRALPKAMRFELIAAASLTAACMLAITVMAWFSYRRGLKTASYVNAPINLYITATHESASAKLSLGDINVKEKDGDDHLVTARDYVFCVRNIDVEEYILQLACTTNNPFTYEVYRAEYMGSANGSIIEENGSKSCTVTDGDGNPQTYTAGGDIVLYADDTLGKVYAYTRFGENLLTHQLNPQAGNPEIANDTLRPASYDTYDEVQQHANPMYYQSDGISGNVRNVVVTEQEHSEYYVLRVRWTEAQVASGAIDNNKETDIVYITAGTKIMTGTTP